MPVKMTATPTNCMMSMYSPRMAIDRAMPQGSSEAAIMVAIPVGRWGVAMPKKITGKNRAQSPSVRP